MNIKETMTNTRATKQGGSETSFRWWVTAIMALILSIGTWNPTGFHFLHYVSVSNPLSGFTPFAILIMLGLWLMAIRSIFQSLGLYGALFIVIMILAFVWGLNQYGLIDLKNFDQLGWIATIGMAIVIWAGLNASKIWKQITGVYSTDRIDDESSSS
ncbi:MAG: hypothetical protein KU28_10700 [Sulfurovum sp. PC08-66]|nr:MAG: hypothetical protein KU28_10700 [Sulfurovum sp. PC08-66]